MAAITLLLFFSQPTLSMAAAEKPAIRSSTAGQLKTAATTAPVHSIGVVDAKTGQVILAADTNAHSSPDHAYIWTAAGRKYFKERNYRLAVDQLHQALIAIQNERTGGPFLFAALRNYAQALQQQGRVEEAQAFFQKARQVAVADKLPDDMTGESGILDVGLNSADRDMKETIFVGGMMRKQRLSGPLKTFLKVSDAAAQRAVLEQAELALHDHKFGQAQRLYEEIIPLLQKDPESAEQLTLALDGLAEVYVALRRFDDANSTYDKALAQAGKVPGQRSLLRATILNNKAACAVQQNDLTGAGACAREALGIFEKSENADELQLAACP
jgi:tetratricopeptide (TPR) repeat protein